MGLVHCGICEFGLFRLLTLCVLDVFCWVNIYIAFHIFSPPCSGTCSRNPSLWNTRTWFSCTFINTVAADHLATWGPISLMVCRAANRYGISVFCTEFTCKIREYEFGLQNTEIELCQFCHIKYCCQNKAYLFWVANQSRFVAFYALKPSNTSLITKTLNLLSSTCSSNTFSCLTSCSCITERIH